MPVDTTPTRKPEWLKIRPPSGEQYAHIKETLRENKLHTVCEEANCPNLHECWDGGTATIMLLGDVCTRGCNFCAVDTGQPEGWVDPLEPWKVAKALSEWGLEYVVLTTVARDDLPDGGAGHIAQTVRTLKEQIPGMMVEVLTTDFGGNWDALAKLVETQPDVVDHNIETVERLTPTVRDPRFSYRQSLEFLRKAKEFDPDRYTKSSIMVGLGETEDEVVQSMRDLREINVNIVTLGQYLQPTKKHLDVQAYVTPEQFKRYEQIGEEMGFMYVASGPLVRSSYRAAEYFMSGVLRQQREGGRANGQEG